METTSWNVSIQVADQNTKKHRTKYKWMVVKYCIRSTYICAFDRHCATVFNLKQYIQYYRSISKFITLFLLAYKSKFH